MYQRGKSPGNRIGDVYYFKGRVGGENGAYTYYSQKAGAYKRNGSRGHRFSESAKHARADLHKSKQEI